MLKLHLGCGQAKRTGWVNIDVDASCNPDQVVDLTGRFSYDDNTVDYIYSEHCFEHLTLEQGMGFLKECRRVLKPNGVIRLSMPDLEEFIHDYQLIKSDHKEVLQKWAIAGWKPGSAAQMLNEEFRRWGHQFIYDLDELQNSFQVAGFLCCYRVKWGESRFAPLESLDMRPAHWGDLIVEAVK